MIFLQVGAELGLDLTLVYCQFGLVELVITWLQCKYLFNLELANWNQAW